MRTPRISISALVTLLVAWAAMGSSPSASVRPHQPDRRRTAVVRVTRGGAQRTDAADAIGHAGQQHDPVVEPMADGIEAAVEGVAVKVSEAGARLVAHGPPGEAAAPAFALPRWTDSFLLVPEQTIDPIARPHLPALGRAPPSA